MGRRIIINGLLALAVGGVALAAESYVVVFKDGSWVRTVEKPIAENGKAHLRLPGGLLTVVDEGRIDWGRSDQRSRQEDLWSTSSPTASPRLPRVSVPAEPIVMVGEPSEGTTADGDEPPRLPATPAPGAEIRQRLSQVQEEMNASQARLLEVQESIRTTIYFDQIGELRRQATELESRIQALRTEQARLILELSSTLEP